MFQNQSNNETEYVGLGAKVDDGSFNDLDRRLASSQTKLESLVNSNDAVAASAMRMKQATQEALDETSNLADEAGRSISAVADHTSRLTQVMQAAADQARGNWNDLRNELMNGGEAGGGGGIGISPMMLRRTGGALTQLGLGTVGQPLQMAGDVAQVAKLGDVVKQIVPSIQAATVSIGGMEIGVTSMISTMAPFAAVAAGVVLAMKLISDQADKAAERVRQEYEADRKFWDQQTANRDKATQITTAQNEQAAIITAQDIKAANDHLQFLQAQYELTQKQYEALGSSFNPAERARLGAQGKQQQEDILDYIKYLNDLQFQFDNQTKALPPLIKQHEDLTKKLEDERKAQAERDAAAERTIELTKQEAQLKKTASSDAIKATIENLKSEQKIISDTLAKGGLSEEEIAKLKARLSDLARQEKEFTEDVLPAIKAREAQEKAERNFADAISSVVDAVVSASQRVQDSIIRTAGIWEKFQQQEENITEQTAQARIDIEDRYQDALIKAAETAVESAQNALDRLEKGQADRDAALEQGLGQIAQSGIDDRRRIAIQEQRSEVQILTDHLRKLQDIKNSGWYEEETAMLNRDVLSLVKQRVAKSQQMDQENIDFQRRREDAKRNEQISLEDQQSAEAMARRDRQAAYVLANQEAKARYNEELNVAEDTRKKNLERAVQTRDKELQLADEKNHKLHELAKQNFINEMKEATLTSEARIKLLQAEASAAYKMAGMVDISSMINGISGGSTGNGLLNVIGRIAGFFGGAMAHRAAGGPLQAGQPSWVNDSSQNRGESFNGSPFPSGLGMFIPMQSGVVQNSGQSIVISVPIDIHGVTDPIGIGRMVQPMVEQTVTNTMRKIMKR